MTRRINIFTTAALALSCALPVSGALAMHESGAGEASRERANLPRPALARRPRRRPRGGPVQVTYRDLRLARRPRRRPRREPGRGHLPRPARRRPRRRPRREPGRGHLPRPALARRPRRRPRRGPVEVTYRDLRSPDARDVTSHPAPAPLVATVAAEPADGFDFGDAGIGAAALLGLFGLGFGSTLILTKGRRQQQVTAHRRRLGRGAASAAAPATAPPRAAGPRPAALAFGPQTSGHRRARWSRCDP